MGILDNIIGHTTAPDTNRPGLFHLFDRSTGNSLQDMGATLSALAWGGHADDYTKIANSRTARNQQLMEQANADRINKAYALKVQAANAYADKIEKSNPQLASALRADPDTLDKITANSLADASWAKQNKITNQQDLDKIKPQQQAETDRQLAVADAARKADPWYLMSQDLLGAGGGNNQAPAGVPSSSAAVPAGATGGGTPVSPPVGSGVPMPSPTPSPVPAPAPTIQPGQDPNAPPAANAVTPHSQAIGNIFHIPNLTASEAQLIQTSVGLKDQAGLMATLNHALEVRGMKPMTPKEAADLAASQASTNRTNQDIKFHEQSDPVAVKQAQENLAQDEKMHPLQVTEEKLKIANAEAGLANAGLEPGRAWNDPYDHSKGTYPVTDKAKAEDQKAALDIAIANKKLTTEGLPPGFMWNDPKDQSKGARRIDGTTEVTITPQAAADLALGIVFDEQFDSIAHAVDDTDIGSDDLGKRGQAYGKAWLGAGPEGEVYRRIKGGQDAMLRLLTGAGMPIEEAKDYTSRFNIELTNDKSTIHNKIDQLHTSLNAMRTAMTNGREKSYVDNIRAQVETERKADMTMPQSAIDSKMTQDQWNNLSKEDKDTLRKADKDGTNSKANP